MCFKYVKINYYFLFSSPDNDDQSKQLCKKLKIKAPLFIYLFIFTDTAYVKQLCNTPINKTSTQDIVININIIIIKC